MQLATPRVLTQSRVRILWRHFREEFSMRDPITSEPGGHRVMGRGSAVGRRTLYPYHVTRPPLEQRLADTLRGLPGIPEGSRIVVGVSGGADSMCLLLALAQLSRSGAYPLELAVVHVDHGIRGSASAADAAFVREWAQALELPFFLHRPVLDPAAGNFESRAREVRIAALRATAGAWRARWIALGHTREDQAETFLMRLARGAGMGSLAGMSELRADGVLRPLLNAARADLRTYLRAQGVDWREDASNDDRRFFRNRVRHDLLPQLGEVLGGDVVGRVVDLTRGLRVEAALADAYVEQLLGPVVETHIPIATLAALPGAETRLLHAWLARLGVLGSRRQFEQMRQIAKATRPSGAVDLADGACVRRRYDRLYFLVAEEVVRLQAASCGWRREDLALPGVCLLPNGMKLRTTPLAAYAAADPPREDCRPVPESWVRGRLWARGPEAGDRIQTPGGTRKISDLFGELAIPRDLRGALTVLFEDEEIRWIPGVAWFGPSAAASDSDTVMLIAEGDLLQDVNTCRKKV